MRKIIREAASFVGDEQFLDGFATGTRVRCTLGDIALDAPQYGAVVVVARPEAVAVTADQDNSDACGHVLDRQLLGNADLLTVALDDGAELTVRTGTYDPPALQ